MLHISFMQFLEFFTPAVIIVIMSSMIPDISPDMRLASLPAVLVLTLAAIDEVLNWIRLLRKSKTK